jgi:hypothetical protein
MSDVQCFLIEPIDKLARYLRRWNGTEKCSMSGMGYHNAEARVENIDIDGDPADSYPGSEPIEAWAADPRWPQRCACGYEFNPEDGQQVRCNRIYRRQGDGEEMPLCEAPAGAMFYSGWYEDIGIAGPDGRSLSVITPGGQWDIDMPSSSGGHWQRSGEPPNVTANPSILIGSPPRYHGWLRNGVLIDA